MKKKKTIKKKIKYIQGINKCDTIIEIDKFDGRIICQNTY